MNIFQVKTIVGLSGNPGDVVTDIQQNGMEVGGNGNGQCFKSSNWADWPLIINSQTEQHVDWTLPAEVGWKFHGGDLVMLQTHYVNATTQSTPLAGRVLANFYTTTPQANELGTIFATNQNIKICPGDMNKSYSTYCTLPGSSNLTIIGANGHFHSRGIDFQIATSDPMGNPGPMFYESKAWDDPPMMHSPQLTTQMPAGGGIYWTCTYDYVCPSGETLCGDPTKNNCFTFGGHVDLQEHCNAFVYYYPKTQNVTCF
jgi:hypothetical protein